jgi:hypothetical protein
LTLAGRFGQGRVTSERALTIGVNGATAEDNAFDFLIEHLIITSIPLHTFEIVLEMVNALRALANIRLDTVEKQVV